MLRLLLIALLMLLPHAAFAADATAPVRLLFPLSCTYGTDCWITAYVDNDAEIGSISDYTCGDRTSDAYNGIDIAIPDRVAMETGVSVLAAADGKVTRVRDGLDDAAPGAEIPEKTVNDCGNGVMIDHGGGWQTLYCHLKKSSITVHMGDHVTAGKEIGEAGQSGAALFPHLHLSVFRNGKIVDPFTGSEATGCNNNEDVQPLWQEGITIPYDPVIIYSAGFKGGTPDVEALKIDASAPKKIERGSDTLSFWAGFFNLKKDDVITLMIIGPDGKEFLTRSITQTQDRARQFYFSGKKVGAGKLAPGTYTGEVVVKRPQSGGAFLTRNKENIITIP